MIDWEAAFGKTYTIQVSLDGNTFTDTATVNNNSAGPKETSFAAQEARYVRILGVQRGTRYGYSFWTASVFGTTSNDPPPTDAAPTSTGAPTISGSTTVGATLQTTSGSWSGNPTSFAYQWLTCDPAGNACANLTGETTNKHTLTSNDLGRTLRVKVTATNAVGSTTATSASTAQIRSAAGGGPVGASLPSRLGSSTGQQYFVDGDAGSDTAAGTVSAPWRSIARAPASRCSSRRSSSAPMSTSGSTR